MQPARRVASKYGDRRYQGPKYSVALCSSISSRSLVTICAPSTLVATGNRPTAHGSLRRPPDEAVTRGCAERAAVGCCRSTDEGGRDGRVRHGAGSAGGAEPTNPLLRGGTAPLAPRLHRLQPHVLPDPVRHLRGRVRRPAERCDRLGCLGRTVPGDLGAGRVPVRATADVP